MRRSLETGRPGQTWHVPECPFPIEWSAAVMEEIRVAAMEALFSVPHGGAEVGGVLWGTRKGGCVRILAARPLECEHALGPTFTLSGKDHARLAVLLEDGCRDLRAQGWEPIGWYHSHTRSEISLSARDVEIHNRYFPDPWHVALVVRPHAMQPMRAGFFFREADGSIHADSSYSEFPVMVGQAVSLATASSPPPEPEPAPPQNESAPPECGPVAPPPPKRSRRWLLWAVIVLGMAAGVFAFMNGFFKKDWVRVFAAGQSPSVSLMAYDLNGQLQIRWDWAAEPIRSAEAGTLEIADGATDTVVALEKQRLRSGTVSYARVGARVDVRLALRQPGGKVYEEFTSFLGQASEPQPDASTVGLRQGLQDQAVRTRELERAVANLRWIVRRDQEARRQDGQR
jgi:proteasome lid subunit RPN8/RPN11